MLTTDEFQAQIRQWRKEGKWEHIRVSSRKRLEARGLIDLGVGSFVRWIEPQWFEEAKKRQVISKDSYGQWIPHVDEVTEEEVVGRRGGQAITEVKKKIDPSRFLAFMKEYNDYSDKKRGREYFESQKQEENKSLINSFTVPSM